MGRMDFALVNASAGLAESIEGRTEPVGQHLRRSLNCVKRQPRWVVSVRMEAYFLPLLVSEGYPSQYRPGHNSA